MLKWLPNLTVAIFNPLFFIENNAESRAQFVCPTLSVPFLYLACVKLPGVGKFDPMRKIYCKIKRCRCACQERVSPRF